MSGGVGPQTMAVVGFLTTVAEELPLSNKAANDEGAPHGSAEASEVEEVTRRQIERFDTREQSGVRFSALDLGASPKTRSPLEANNAGLRSAGVDEPEVVVQHIQLARVGGRRIASGSLTAGRTSHESASKTTLSVLEHFASGWKMVQVGTIRTKVFDRVSLVSLHSDLSK